MTKKKGERGSAKWQRFEDMVAEIQRSLAPKAKLSQNEHVMGNKSHTLREVDISVRQSVGQYEMFVAIDCKDYNKPVNLKGVEEFMGLVDDIGAHQGVMVSARGFSPKARVRAKGAGIQLYRPVSARDHEWKVLVTIPILCDFRHLRSYAFQFVGSGKGGTRIPLPFEEMVLYRADGTEQDTALRLVERAWNSLPAPPEPGKLMLVLGERPSFFKSNEEQLCSVEMSAEIIVQQTLFFGNVPLREIEGFHDENEGGILTTQVTTDHIRPEDILRSWKRLESEAEMAVKPLLRMKARGLFDEERRKDHSKNNGGH